MFRCVQMDFMRFWFFFLLLLFLCLMDKTTFAIANSTSDMIKENKRIYIFYSTIGRLSWFQSCYIWNRNEKKKNIKSKLNPQPITVSMFDVVSAVYLCQQQQIKKKSEMKIKTWTFAHLKMMWQLRRSHEWN